VFTQRELFWLDDILPGAKLDDHHKKKPSDAEKANEKVMKKKLIIHSDEQQQDNIASDSNNYKNSNFNIPSISISESETSKLVNN
jgi:hypothetical protein